MLFVYIHPWSGQSGCAPFRFFVLTARGLEIAPPDDPIEHTEVREEVERPNHQHLPRLDIQDVEEGVVDCSVGEAVAQPGAKEIEKGEGEAGQENVGDIEEWRNEQERILNGFGDARQKRGKPR
jgi:hypothetical protein